MCGRFPATVEFSDIRVRWNLDRDLSKYTPRFNIAPETSPNIPVIVRHQGGNECAVTLALSGSRCEIAISDVIQ